MTVQAEKLEHRNIVITQDMDGDWCCFSKGRDGKMYQSYTSLNKEYFRTTVEKWSRCRKCDNFVTVIHDMDRMYTVMGVWANKSPNTVHVLHECGE